MKNKIPNIDQKSIQKVIFTNFGNAVFLKSLQL